MVDKTKERRVQESRRWRVRRRLDFKCAISGSSVTREMKRIRRW
jgi:hypothetical protein